MSDTDAVMFPALRVRRVLDGLGLACLGLLILEISIEFLPSITVLRYVTTTRLLVLLGLASLLLRVLAAGEWRRWGTYRSTESVVLLSSAAALLCWQTFSAAVNGAPTGFSFVRLLGEEALALVLVAGLVDEEDKLDAVLVVFLVAASAVSLHAVRQVVGQENTTHFLVWRDGAAAGAHAEQMPAEAIVRAVGYFDDPNVLAAYLVLLIPLVLYVARRLAAPGWATALLVSLPAVALLLTFSRSGIVGLLLAAGLVTARQRPGSRVALACLVGVLAVAVLVNPLSTGRWSSAVSPRLAAWSTAAGMILHDPLFGVGVGNFRARTGLWHAHNLILHTAAEAGLVAGVLVVVLLGAAIKKAFKLAHRHDHGGSAGRASAIALVAFGIISLVDNPYNARAVSYTLWLLLGLLIAANRIFDNDPLTRERALRGVAPAVPRQIEPSPSDTRPSEPHDTQLTPGR